MPANITFHYFHGRGIGEPVRLLFTVGHVEFTDRRYTVEEFADQQHFKESLPFGQMPALEIDGVFLGQTDSIARLAARLAGLYPEDPIIAAKSDMIVVHQAEIQSSIAKMSYDGVPGAPGTQMVPPEEKQKRIDAWFKEKLPGSLQRIENLASDSLVLGPELSWADICIFNRLNQLLDIDDGLLKNAYPKLTRIYQTVEALPEIQQWIRKHPDDYPRFDK